MDVSNWIIHDTTLDSSGGQVMSSQWVARTSMFLLGGVFNAYFQARSLSLTLCPT